MATVLSDRWSALSTKYLPAASKGSIWRLSRVNQPGELQQGWKLHVCATILEACDVFERVAPYLSEQKVRFKAPASLDELGKLNSGLQYGYHQVGKFITVYPRNERDSLRIASALHRLTRGFTVVNIPFDEQYAEDSLVFYRYGAFSVIEATGEDGCEFHAILDPSGKLVPDDRRIAVPSWVSDPFPNKGMIPRKGFERTPLENLYRVFEAITQRGKGGTYRAFYFGTGTPFLCIIKEGRKNGELAWSGQDGFELVQNEFEVLKQLAAGCISVPRVFERFKINENLYISMEFISGTSLAEMIKWRRKRLSLKRVSHLARELIRLIEEVHSAGWVWNDCKPAILIVSAGGALRPIDFENSFRIGTTERFDWKSEGFAKNTEINDSDDGRKNDTFAAGAVIYFLLTGRLHEPENPVPAQKLRRGIPPLLLGIVDDLLGGNEADLGTIRERMQRLSESL